ncbi:MAG: bifunctional [glutamine synthetase] adenylyltransferase/[glutamine synthetase]-adenylyl-L-tyrosine phosphorylase [Paracoccaceae bacterium]|nr:bifunctional [glutamine synthetase] adenylyltransferase/[glutamine synthetase]-adenylyl-L-tyrosine phosphorylase [Paracoccaceae bacterium]
MSIAHRLTRLPHPYDPDRGAEARAAVPDAQGDIARLIEGTGGCSPYLKTLIEREAAWIMPALDDPEGALTALHHDLSQTAPDALADALRQGKRRVALLTALADLSGAWSLEEVTSALTRFADLACQLALRAAIGAEIKRGKLPGATEDDAENGGGLVALAMGKMGAYELNYSSDIDLICLFDETRFTPDDYHEARASLIRATRKMAALLNDNTAQGYVFRTDLRLRPDPAVTPVCMAMEAAERYYESLGRTWERAAYIKARPSAGDLAAGERFLKTLRPFVWRKHLDFAAIQDAHDMRLRIRAHKGLGGPVVLTDHNMKLGRGGIREIEFFTQTRQIIAGGRDPDLRVRGTVEGLAVLARKGWIPDDVAHTLTGHYRAHREVEHRLQMINDAQTHSLPRSDEGFARLAAFMGMEQTALEADLKSRISEVHDLTEGFFAGSGITPSPQVSAEVADTLDTEVTSRWRSYPALRSARAVEIFQRLRPEILSRLARAAKPDEALLAFDGFLSGLPAGVQLFSLFDVNPQLIDLLVDIVGSSPALAQHLSRNSGVFDAVIGGGFFAPWPGMKALRDELSARLEGEADYERKLDAARRWAKEWHFRIGVHHLRGLIDAEAAGPQYADLAEAVLRALWPVVVAQFAAKHGTPPGRGAMVLGMGSLGAGRLNATSDLDLIVIYDADGVENSDGRRPLAARPYYARLTQAMVTALTAPMAEGKLYEVDMRLRPSGTQGPVATSLTSFRDYQMNEAWIWEHLALTRARAVAGEAALAEDVEAVRQAVLARGHPRDKIIEDVAAMRARIAAAKSAEGPWDAKLGPGRLQDVELIGQAGSLMAGSTDRQARAGLRAAVACGWLDDATGAALTEAYLLFWRLQLVSKLLSDKPLDPAGIGEGGCRMLLRETGFETLEGLEAALVEVAAGADAAIHAALGTGSGEAI